MKDFEENNNIDSSENNYFNHLHDDEATHQENNSDISSQAAHSENDSSASSHSSAQEFMDLLKANDEALDSDETASTQEPVNEDSTYHYSYKEASSFNNNDKASRKQRRKMEKAAKKAARKAKGGTGRYITRLVASALVFGLVAGTAFQGFNYCYYKINPSASAANQIQPTTTLNTSGDTIKTTTDLSQMVANVMPSIVSITSVIEQHVNYGFWGEGGTQEAEGAGSGIIIGQNKSELLVVTNYHVVDGAKKLSVGFSDSSTVEATVKGTDPDADLAVVSVPLNKMSASTKGAIKVATLGKSSSLKVGEPAIAIGNALGYGQSVTAGYVSALNREVTLTDKTMNLLQTDAAINPGNSGGALLNMKGEVIGINTVKYSDTTVEGMGYAIPIDTASPIITSLMKQETIPEGQKAYLGITGSDVTESYSQQLNLPTGIYVQSVQAGSPAEKGGLYAGDVITKFDGNSVSSMESLSNKISHRKAGEEVTITVKRMNQQGTFEEKDLKITLASKKDFR